MKAKNLDKTFIRNFLLFAILLISGVAALSYYFIYNDRKLGTFDDWVTHTYEVISEAEELDEGINSILATQRGYLLTGDKEFLKKYTNHKQLVSQKIQILKNLTDDNVSQQVRLEKLEDYYEAFYNKLEQRTLDYQKTSNKEEAREIILTGLEEVSAIRKQFLNIHRSILAEENNLLKARVGELEVKKKQYLTTLIGGVVTGAVLLLILNAYLLRAQRKRAVVERDLKSSEDRFILALEGTQDGIYDWDIKKDVVFYSNHFFGMLGYKDKPQYGTKADFTDLIHPDDREGVWRNVEQYLNGELSEYSYEFRMKAESGRWVWIQTRGRALFEKGKAYRMVGAHTDITHLKYEQERLEAEKINAERANAAKGDFLAHMSHEIRTPLTAISGIAEIFERNLDNLDEKQKKLVKTLNTSSAALKDLINDILDYSKIDSGDLDLDERAFSLEELFAGVVSMMSVRANEKGISFVMDDSEVKGADFYGDDHRLRQILVNLIGNALKFTDSGGSVSVKAQFEDRDGQDFLRIGVSDTGIGISAEDFDSIFERFQQADSSVTRKYGGTGLGLPISRSLAQLMGGDIFLSSQIKKGSTFSLLVPMKLEIVNENDDQIYNRGDNKKLSEKIQSAMSGTTRTLVVEDYEGNIAVIGYILDELDISYDVAKNGVEALKLWHKNYYDFVLMDVQMPEMDGFETTSRIRKEEKEKSMDPTPIIGMTAHALVGDKDKCIKAGMDVYLPKPIVEKDLKKQIYKYLNKRKKAA